MADDVGVVFYAAAGVEVKARIRRHVRNEMVGSGLPFVEVAQFP